MDTKSVYRTLFILHLFVGVGAIGGGLAAILDPMEPLGVPVELLEGSPFTSYLIPGVVLFTLFGVGNVISAAAIHFSRSKLQCYISGILGLGLVIWILVQVVILGSIVFLHALYFFIGIIITALSVIVFFRRQ